MDDAALLAAVVAAPDDDAPRLVYADFLTSRGDPRGDFITLQCRLAAARDDEARRKLRIAENKLLKAHEPTWSAGFFSVAKSTPDRRVKVAFHRGFLEEATLPLSALDDLEPLFREAPLLRRLRFDSPHFTGQTLAPPTLTGRLASARLRGVRSLELRVPAGGDAVAVALSQCAHLSGLRRLCVEASAWPVPRLDTPLFSGDADTHLLTAVGARSLATAPQLAGVVELDLSANHLGPLGVRAVVDGTWRLESLSLNGTGLDAATLEHLAAAPGLKQLTHLALKGGDLSEVSLEALARSKTLTALTSLDLTAAQVGPKALSRFLAALKLPKLTSLGLAATELGDEGAQVLARSAVSRQLTSLELGENEVTQKGVFALADSAHLGGLTRLLLNDAWLGKKAVVEYLAASPTLAGCRIYVKGSLLGRAEKKAPSEKPKKSKSTSKK